MKFTDGFWRTRPGVTPLYAQEAYDIEAEGDGLVVTAPTAPIRRRGDVLNRATLTVRLDAPLDDVVRVRVSHFDGARQALRFPLPGAEKDHGSVRLSADTGELQSGELTAVVQRGAPWSLRFEAGGKSLTSSGHHSLGHIEVAPGADVSVGLSGVTTPAPADRYMHAQLSLGIGELIYGLGERFGPIVRNGQSVDIWNADGGTMSEQAYKNVPFYLSNRGYGVFVNHAGHVSFEVGTEAVEQVQFAVAGESLEFLVIHGKTPAAILERYTALTGRPALVPAWSFGTWLSTSFTAGYDAETVIGFVDGMAERSLPLSVFHFDCFWMREFNWCDFEWDPRTFPDPEGLLEQLHARGLRVSVWINPYIAQRSAMFAEGAEAGYLLRRADGSVWQTDMWQAGIGLVDFTNPEAREWYRSKLRRLLRQGVDCFKTDFGERVPVDVVHFDGSAPEGMHNYYTQLYNEAVFSLLVEERGEDEAVVFARSATAGGHRMPVHWNGDSTSTFASMAETLRGGLSLACAGFGFWSHDIGGFEGTPDAEVFKRWAAFGLLCSHSRFHGSDTYRVPWAFDDEAVEVVRRFSQLKLRLMPYLYQAAVQSHRAGAPVLRPMFFEFPGDRNVGHVDTQYMLGEHLLVAPVFSASGEVEVYLPQGLWTDYATGAQVAGPLWRYEQHSALSLPLYVREGGVIAHGPRDDRPDYDFRDDVTLAVYPGPGTGGTDVEVPGPDGREPSTFAVTWDEAHVRVEGPAGRAWSVRLGSTGEHGARFAASGGVAEVAR